MKRFGRFFLAALALCLSITLLGACFSPVTPQATAAATESATAAPTVAPTAAPAETPSPVPTLSSTPEITVTPVPTPTPAPTPTPTPEGPRMYSSYADLISFDPETGIAKFDYFDMLRGSAAIEFLIEHEGYTRTAAEALVENFADSEYVKKNTNPQLRAIDIDDVPLKLMWKPNGDPVNDSTPISATAANFRAIYALDTSLLLESYFFYIHVDGDGQVTLVEQVYWP
jgi:hypothetical protein